MSRLTVAVASYAVRFVVSKALTTGGLVGTVATDASVHERLAEQPGNYRGDGYWPFAPNCGNDAIDVQRETCGSDQESSSEISARHPLYVS